MRVSILVCGALAVLASGCVRSSPLSKLPVPKDAPFELAEDHDLERFNAAYYALRRGDAQRSPRRLQLLSEFHSRTLRALSRGDRDRAHETFVQALRLWHPDELRPPIARDAAFEDLLTLAREVYGPFARAGDARETLLALSVLQIASPSPEREQEVEEILAYVDDLLVGEAGPDARGAARIELLEEVVEALPLSDLVDRLSDLYVARQVAFKRILESGSPDHHVLRAHHSVVQTVRDLIWLHALAGRVERAAEPAQTIKGIGEDRSLLGRLMELDNGRVSAASVVALAQQLESPQAPPHKRGFRAALRLVQQFLPAHDDAVLVAAAGSLAQRLGYPELATRYYEHALALSPEEWNYANELASLYHQRLHFLSHSERPSQAAKLLSRVESFHEKTAQRWAKRPPDTDVADAYGVVGDGLVTMGKLDEATVYLKRSLARRPTLAAYETLAFLALQREQQDDALYLLDAALRMTPETLPEHLIFGRLLRLRADAHGRAGDDSAAQADRRKALTHWRRLAPNVARLRDATLSAEILIESAKVLWYLGEEEVAIAHFENAVDLDPDGEETHAQTLSFLVVRNQYPRALDTFHRALGSRGIGDYFKVYMSLWILAEAKRIGAQTPPLAEAYLRGREGRLWYDDLARFATGRLALPDLVKRAHTRGRRAEILYYAAVLGDRDPKRVHDLLEQVIETEMVRFFEYEMARHWLRSESSP